eukprot:6517823-Prymnesium_polylepis.1
MEDEDEDAHGGPVLVLPLYSMLPAAEQMRVWAPPPKGTRLIIAATNVRAPALRVRTIRACPA